MRWFGRLRPGSRTSWAHAFEYACAKAGIDHRNTKPKHPWTQVERMNRTIKDTTVKRFHSDDHEQLRRHLKASGGASSRRCRTIPLEYLIVDSTIVRAHQHAAGAKRGSEHQTIGRSRGGLSTEIHMVVRGLGCPVRVALMAGQKGDVPEAGALIEGLPADVVMADAASDSDRLRRAIAAKGAVAVIPNNPSRTRKYPLAKHLYAERHLIECCFSKLNQFRRVATRFEKTARKYLAIVTLAATILWLR